MAKPTYQIVTPSGTTNFLPINITATTSGTANIIHAADAVNFDELWLRAYNYTNNDSILYLCLGGTASYQIVPIPVPAMVGELQIINGDVYTGGVEIKAYASTANSIAVQGRINRIVFI